MYRKLLLSLITLIACQFTQAQQFSLLPNANVQPVYSSVIATSGTTYPCVLPIVKDYMYDTLATAAHPNGNFKSMLNYVAVGIRNDTPVITSKYKYWITLTVAGKICPTCTTINPAPKQIALELSYDPDSLKPYTDKSLYKFSGSHAVVVTIDKIEDISGTTPVTVSRNALPKNFYIETGVITDDYDNSSNPNNVPLYATSYFTNSDNNLHLTWGTSPGYSNLIQPLEYELEWTYIDDYQYNIATHTGSHIFQYGAYNGNIPYDFRKNSTRVRLKKNEFDLPLVYEGGAVVFRLRIVRPDYSKSYKDVLYGAWNLADAGTVTSTDVTKVRMLPAPHMNDSLNWQYTINFAEEGKYKHVINYFDGSLRGRQTQTKINSDSLYIIASDKSYDYEGHPAIQTLPTPLQQTYLGYRDDVVRVGSSRPYKPSDYDRVSCSQPDSLPPLLSSSAAGNYYSSANTDTSKGQKFVPDAKGYPIIQSIYSPDNMLLWQGGAGYDHQLWTLHGTRYEYTQPLDGELSQYFKNEAGLGASFLKKVTMDPNMQSSFVISNPAGKPVMTGLIGYPNGNTPIESISDQNNDSFCSDILNGAKQIVSSDGISINRKFYVEIDGQYSIQYRAKIPAYNIGCGRSILARAHYDFSATDECGIARIPKTTGFVGFDSVVTSMPAGFDYYSSAASGYPLVKGNHTVDKSLLFNRYEVNNRVRQGVLALEAALCSPDEKEFVRASVESASVPCVTNVVKDSCGGRIFQLIKELYPGQKYGKYERNSNGGFAMDTVCTDSSGVWVLRLRMPTLPRNENSIFSADTICTTWMAYCGTNIITNDLLDPSCLKFRYQSSCISMPGAVVKNGRTYTDIKNLPVDTFIYIFNDDIARALLPLHPEFCKTAYCDDGEYIASINAFQTQKQAVQGNRFVLDSIIANDPYYKKANSTDKPGVKQRLSHMKNMPDKRIDRLALEQAFCAAGNGQEVEHNIKFLYADTIQNFRFVDSSVKQRYFEALKGLYLGNRAYILQKALDSSSATCSPCAAGRLTLVEPSVFPHLFSSNSNEIAADINMPSWLKTVFNNSMNPSYNPSGFNPPPANVTDSLINPVKDSLAKGTVDAIMHKLINCTLNQDTILLIKNRLLYYVGLGSELTPTVIKAALNDVNVSTNDLCHSFLLAYNTDKDEQEYSYDCGRPEIYTGLKYFLWRSDVNTSIMGASFVGSGHIEFNLSASNSFENKIAAKLGLSSNTDPVWVEGFLDTIKYSSTVSLKYVKLKVSKPNTSTCIYFYFKRKLSSSPYLDSSTSLIANSVDCINNDDGLNTGYATQYTAIVDYYINGNNTVNRRYYVWSKDIPLMNVADGKLPLACLTCVDIKNAIKSFVADKSTYGYDEAGNHPFVDLTLTNYLNYKLNKHHSYYEYVNLMKGCAISDSVEMPNRAAFMRYITSSDIMADTIINFINRYTTRKILDRRIKYYGTGNIYLDIDVSVVPFDSMLRYKKELITLGINSGASIINYMPTDPLRVLRSTTCTPSPYITTYGSFSKDLAAIYNGKTLQYVDSVFTYTGSYASPYAHASLLANLKNYISTCSNSYLLKDAQLYRTEDYNTTNKQNYLTYVYALEGKSRNDIRDSIEADNLKNRLAGVSTMALRYDDPACGDNMRDLYIGSSVQSSHPGSARVNSIFGWVSGVLGTGKLFLVSNSNTQSINANLKVYRKASGVHWYRYFDPSNTLYNVYLEPPANAPFDINTLILDNVKIGPGTDSIYRFTAYMHYSSVPTETIQCRGYASFPLGYGQRVQDVVLYNKPGGSDCIDSIDCEYLIQEQAILAGKARHAYYFDSTVASHSNKMYQHLLANTRDSLYLCSRNAKNMVTLYYYDLNGNLQRTVPPKGVDASGNAAHTKATTYFYDSRNLLRRQVTPDGGTTNFYYDAAGRLAFTQNDKQKALGKYSYTLYDDQSRPRETGEVILTSPNAAAPVYVEYSYNDENYPTDTLVRYVRTQTRYDVVVTTYDTMKTDIGAITGEHLSTQENLINRVSTTTYYQSKIADYNGGADPTPQFVTYYSYDAVGNVKTVSYNCPAMLQSKQQYKRVDYDYDQIGGKVNMISYNRNRPDQFYQRYDYDADNRITSVETSNDGLIWNKDARYRYYKHGPLANVKIGNNLIQSLDYAYTIQGWLKSINGDVLRTDKQMVPDGAVGDISYARDAMAHTIDYFADDYKPIVSSVNGFNFANPSKSLYNGNIARTTTAIRGVSNSGGVNDNMRATYTYDQAQRLVKAAYENINESNLTASATGKFASNYQYDLDGNLKWLTRYNGASTPVKIDSIKYNYTSNTNRLTYAADNASNIVGGDDFQQGQPVNNYKYDLIGNLERDSIANQKMEWNLYGKLRSVDFLNSSPKRKLWYDYDGQGNRIRKDMVTSVGGGNEEHRGEYYVRDASGNILATYKFNTIFSKISLIKLSNTGVYGNSNFPKFVNAVAVGGSFVKGFADKAVDNMGTWVDAQTDKPTGFYFNNSPALYGNILTGPIAADYLNDLQAYDATAAPQIFSNALMGSPTVAANIVDEVLNFTTEGKALLEHFDTQLPDMELNQMWTNLGIDATRTPMHNQNADTLYKWMKLNSQQPAVVGAIQTLVMDPGVNSQSQAFYHAVMQDDVIFESTNLRGPSSTFGAQVQDLVHANAEQSQVMEFLDGWATTRDWLAENTTLSERMQLVYSADPDIVLGDWLANAVDVEVLDTILANAEDVLAFDYYDARVNTNGTYNVGLPPLEPVNIYSFGPVVDTTNLAEHHIYGSSRLGVQNYKDSIYRQTYNVNTSITPLTGLSTPAVWYDNRYNDLIDAGEKEPYMHSHLGELYLSRTLGHRHYELTDHLGNVLATVLDRKTGHTAGGGATSYNYYLPDISTAQGYYPFGQRMKEWHNEVADTVYKFGYNGKLRDDELYGAHKFQDYGMRKYNPMLARFVSVDPLTRKYPELTPYQFAGNTPIQAVDLDGLEPWYTNEPVAKEKSTLKADAYGPLSNEYAGSHNMNGLGRILQLDDVSVSPSFSDKLYDNTVGLAQNYEFYTKDEATISIGTQIEVSGRLAGREVGVGVNAFSMDLFKISSNLTDGNADPNVSWIGKDYMGTYKQGAKVGIGIVSGSIEREFQSGTGGGPLYDDKLTMKGTVGLPVIGITKSKVTPLGNLTTGTTVPKVENNYSIDVGISLKFLIGLDYNIEFGLRKK